MLMLSMLTLFEALTYNILNMIYFAVWAAAVYPLRVHQKIKYEIVDIILDKYL